MTALADARRTHTTLAAASIRPHDAHAAFRDLLERRRAEITVSDGRLRAPCSLDTVCPLCESDQRRPELDDRGLSFHRCLICGLVYQSPRLRPELLDEFFANSPAITYFHEHVLAPTAEIRKKRVFAPRIDELNRRVLRAGRLLDVGCATGQFLEMAREREWQVTGVEPNAFAADYCRSRFEISIAGPSIQAADLPDESFDAVSLWEVIGHLFDPLDTLHRCFRALRPGGVLMLTTPNIDGFEYRVLRECHENLNGVLFLNFFSTITLRLLLEEAGLDDIEISTPGRMDVENVAQALRNSRAALPADPFWRDLLLSPTEDYAAARTAFQNILSEHRLSGHMLAFARKPGA